MCAISVQGGSFFFQPSCKSAVSLSLVDKDFHNPRLSRITAVTATDGSTEKSGTYVEPRFPHGRNACAWNRFGLSSAWSFLEGSGAAIVRLSQSMSSNDLMQRDFAFYPMWLPFRLRVLYWSNELPLCGNIETLRNQIAILIEQKYVKNYIFAFTRYLCKHQRE